MSFGGSKMPKVSAPVIAAAPQPEVVAPPPTIVSEDVNISKLDLLEKERRKRARAASSVVEPGFLSAAAVKRPLLKGVLG